MNIQDAIEIAVRAHAGQFRKGTESGFQLPYVSHCFDVAKLVWSWGAGDPITMAAAYLHDVLEDTPEDLRSIVVDSEGQRVRDIVCELSFFREKWPSKELYLNSFRDKAKTSPEALVIKVADRICNVRDFASCDPPYAVKYMDKAALLKTAMLDRIKEIEDMFGEHAFIRMFATWTGLRESLDGDVWR